MSLRLVALLFSALLAGCGGLRLIESDVHALSTLASGDLAASGGLYRFERLLSQQAQPGQQAELEAIVERALAKAGMQRASDPALARYGLTATARSLAYLQNDEGGLAPIGPGHSQDQVALGIGGRSGPLPTMRPTMLVTFVYRMEVVLILRDLQSGKIVFEAGARHEGPWPDSATLYAIMFEAALRDFPSPAPGTRRIRIEIPR